MTIELVQGKENWIAEMFVHNQRVVMETRWPVKHSWFFVRNRIKTDNPKMNVVIKPEEVNL